MAPDLVEEFITAFTKEENRQRRDNEAARSTVHQELATVKRKLAGLLDAIAEGIRGPDLQNRLDELAARKEALLRALEEPATSPIRLHPNLAQIYRQKIEQLHHALSDPAIRDEAVQILRGLIDRIVVQPAGDEIAIEITGEIARMVELGLEGRTSKQAVLDERTACSVKVVAGAGFEPATFRL